MNNISVSSGNPYPLGSYITGQDSVNIAFVNDNEGVVGINLYDKKSGKKHEIIFNDDNRIGNIHCAKISGINPDDFEYTFFEDDREYCDPFGKLIIGNEKWGKIPVKLRSAFVKECGTASNMGKSRLMTDYSDSILYLAHVRGFTKHKSSGVAEPGTFEGIVEKIPHLLDLGVTALELMPAYEFIELEETAKNDNELIDSYSNVEPKLNYWGYKSSYYFAPKASYAAKGNKATDSFKRMISELHKAGIELIMQFYFPQGIKQALILEVLKYWVLEYQVDGFHLMGDNMPLALLGTEPMLVNTKMMYYDFPVNDIYGNDKPKFKNLAIYNDEYMYNVRRFVKSDEGQIRSILHEMRDIGDKLGKIHYVTNCNGFTLMDLVSYDRKHNMDNGENDRDGNPYNASWNCGVEGPTSRKVINRLRRKQIKNLIAINVLTQSTPMILAGDEFGNTQKGNNNPYCIDNLITWLNWNDIVKNNDIFEFYKSCIEFRKKHNILHMNRAFRMTDYCGIGCPDLSLHGEEAWKVETDDLTRHFAMLYSNEYAKVDINGKALNDKEEPKQTGDYIYIAINMHWTEHGFALPKLPIGKEWQILFDTNRENSFVDIPLSDSKKIVVKDRSIIVLKSK